MLNGIFIFLLYLMLEPIKRIISMLLYPLAYLLRKHIRTNKVFVKEYLYHWRNGWFFLWIFLNDSEYFDGTNTEYGDSEGYYPKWIWNSGSEFLKSYWFNAIRNSCVNLNNYLAYKLGKFVFERIIIGNDRNFIQVR